MDGRNRMEGDGYLCFPLDPETAECFAGLYIGETEELAKKTALGVTMDSDPAPKPVGLMVLAPYGDDLRIEWAHVHGPEGENERIARKLMNTLLIYAHENGFSKLTALVPEAQDWLLALYREYGFVFDYESYGEIVTRLMCYKNEARQDSRFLKLKDLLPTELAAFCMGIETRAVFCPLPLPIEKNDYLPESPVFAAGGKVHAVLLVQKEAVESGFRLILPWLYADVKGKAVLAELYSHAVSALREAYPEDTEIRFCALRPTLKRTAEKLFSKVDFVPWSFGRLRLNLRP